MSGARARLLARCSEVVADGSDPAALAAVVAWTVRPRRSPDALRRACRDAVEDRDRSAGPAWSQATPSARLAAAAGRIVDHDADAAEPLVAAWRERGVRVALVGDRSYPARLAEGWPHVDAPSWLAWRGTPAWDAPAVAIVGARRATGYGGAIAAWLADAAARAGIRVVSGGALGIDAAAHRAAVELPGGTSVILGCGHAVPYPRPHAIDGGLFDQTVEHGGAVVSELLPFQPPRAGPVRARNRIVAALADVVVVVEGGARSGSLLTAGAAAERGRTVLAVPGDVRAPGSAAPHRLLADGVGPCTGPDDLLAAFAGHAARRTGPVTTEGFASDQAQPPHTGPSILPPPVHRVLAARWPRPVRLEQLATDAELPVPTLLAAITRATVAGEVVDGADGVRLRRAPDGTRGA
jgi:DNA processing protein